MERSIVKIVWTDPAKADLKDIFNFYLKVSPELAERIVQQIIAYVGTLQSGFPNIGHPEPLLEGRKENYRFLVTGNHKVIYRVQGKEVIINSVFDTRQDPSKLQKKFKPE